MGKTNECPLCDKYDKKSGLLPESLHKIVRIQEPLKMTKLNTDNTD